MTSTIALAADTVALLRSRCHCNFGIALPDIDETHSRDVSPLHSDETGAFSKGKCSLRTVPTDDLWLHGFVIPPQRSRSFQNSKRTSAVKLTGSVTGDSSELITDY